MKLRSLFVFGAGVLAGLTLARKMHEDDPVVLHGPSTASTSNPTLKIVTSSAQRLADKAGVASLDAIRRTRGRIKDRLGEDGMDDAAWS
jgi:hypothetical protein